MNESSKIYSASQIIALPKPVQRYFKYVLKDEMPYQNLIKLKHNGMFRANLKKGFTRISGIEYFSASTPQFVWKGSTMLFTVIDSFISDVGNLKVLLFNIFIVADDTGSQINEGELQRWLAESVWFPTNLLPSEILTWSEIDEKSAKLSFQYKEISFEFIVGFNADGGIETMETMRFMTTQKREAWLCKMGNYKEINRVKIPVSTEAIWKLKEGDFSYAKFEVKEIKYN